MALLLLSLYLSHKTELYNMNNRMAATEKMLETFVHITQVLKRALLH